MKEVRDDDLVVGKTYRYMMGVNEVGKFVFNFRVDNALWLKKGGENDVTFIHSKPSRIWRYYDEDNELKFGR